MLSLFLFKVANRLSEKEKTYLLSYLSSSEKKDLSRYKTISHLEMSLVGKFILKMILAKKLAISINAVEIAKKELGSPYIKKPTNENIDISISHSGNCIALSISDIGKVGVDIEKIIPLKLDAIHGIFTDEENRYIFSTQIYAEQLRRFYEIWTIKEAYSKSIGKGLSAIPHMKFIRNNLTIANDRKRNYSLITYENKGMIISLSLLKKINLEFLRKQKIKRVDDLKSLKIQLNF